MEDLEIKKALESIEVRPSAKCWRAIESGLPAAGTATTIAAQKGIFHLTSTTAKVIVGSAAAAIVAAAITIPILSKQPQAKVTPTQNQIAIVDTATIISNLSPDTNAFEPVIAIPTSQNIIDNQSIVKEESTNIDNNSALENAPIAKNTTPSQTPSVLISQPQPSVSQSTPINNNVASDNTTNTQPQQNITTQRIIKDDPVLVEQNIIADSRPISITIPNVFTPNGDGVNDQFIILGIEDCDQHRLIIKNRAGKIVYQSTQYHNDWTAEGLPEGSYYYQFAYRVDGIEEVRSGALTILR